MGIEDLRQTERQVRALIAQSLGALSTSVAGQQVHAEAAQRCMDAAGESDIHRLYAARALAVIANGAEIARELDQNLLDGLGASNIPENEILTIQASAREAVAFASEIASVAKAAADVIAAQQDAPALLQGVAGELNAAPTISGNSAQHLIDAQSAAGRAIRDL